MKKHRSPNYPYTGLEDALEKTRLIQNEGRNFFVPFTVAKDAWGYKSDGTAHSVVASLKAYGLIEVQGEKERKEIKVSESGRKILDDHSDRNVLLKEAALKPSLHNELWNKYDGSLPPSNKMLAEYLKYERDFNPTAVDSFIDQFRATIVFAKLTSSDKIEDDKEEKSLVNIEEVKGGISNQMQTIKQAEITSQNSQLLSGQIGKLGIEFYESGRIEIAFTGSMNNLTLPILNEIYKLKEKYEPKEQVNHSEHNQIKVLENDSDN